MARLPDALREAGNADAVTALGSSLPERLADAVTQQTKRCHKAPEAG